MIESDFGPLRCIFPWTTSQPSLKRTCPHFSCTSPNTVTSAIPVPSSIMIYTTLLPFLVRGEMEIVRELPLSAGLIPSATEGLEGHIQMGELAGAQIMLARVAGRLPGHSNLFHLVAFLDTLLIKILPMPC